MLRTFPCFLFIVAALGLFSVVSCNNHADDIPFPVNNGFLQPTSKPLQFSAAKPFHWDTVKTGGLNLPIKKLDIDALPSIPYDTLGFKPFAKAPEEVHFEFNTLPEATIDIDKLTSKSLEFKTTYLPPPFAIKASFLVPKSGTTLSIDQIGKPQGLDATTIYGLLKDRNGFIWIGADKGLYRYNGEYMQRYLTHSVMGIQEDNNGRIWWINRHNIGMVDPSLGTESVCNKINMPPIGLPTFAKDDKGCIWLSHTQSPGVFIIDPQSEKYKLLDKNAGLSGTDVWSVFNDDKKNMWLTTTDGGVDILNIETGKIRYLRKQNGLSSDTLEAITGDKKKNIYIAFANGGFDQINPEQGSIKRFGRSQGFNIRRTLRLLYDNQDQLWMGTDVQLTVVNIEKGMVNFITENEGLASDFFTTLLQDDKQRIWVGGASFGVNIINQNGQLVYPVGAKQISTLLEDSKEKLWVGTSTEGVDLIDENKHRMTHIGQDQGISNNLIQAFLEANGKIWVTTNGGVDIIDETKGTLEHIGKEQGIRNPTIYAVAKGIKNDIFFTGPSEGVDMIDSGKNIFLHASVNEGLSDSTTLDVKQDMQGKIWLATNFKGVDIIDPEKATIQNLNDAPGLRDSSLKLMLKDEQGRIWIGTQKGLYIADTKQNTITTITTKEGLSNDYINSLIEYKGSVIVGTINKINIITPPTTGDTLWKVKLMAGSEGLVNLSGDWNSNFVTNKGQYLWGDNGVTIINDIKEEQDSETVNVTRLIIMSEPQYFSNNLSLNDKDTVWSADTFFVKGQKVQNTGYAGVNGFRCDSVTGPYNLPVNLEVPYDQDYFQFQFAQQHLGRKDTTSYCYILEGIDKHWSTPSSNPFTENYLNLSPGKYILKVRSKNIDGLWSEPAAFSFTILPPWWKTWWMYIIYAIIIGFTIRLIVYYRSQKLIRENRLLEEKIEHRTNQLKKSIEDLKSTQTQLIQSEKMASLGELAAGIAHEIQNPLNFVNNFSEVNTELIDELKDEVNKINTSDEQKLNINDLANDIKQNQEKISFHGKRADSIVKGMLQHSRSSSGVKELTDINNLADEYLRLAYHGLRAKDKTFNATMNTAFDPNVGKINVVPQDLGRVILNLITNAFYSVTEKKKQQPEGSKFDPTVTVSTKKGVNKIEIAVEDNGNGIPQKVLDKIYQPFFTTKPTGQGTGLGLSMSYEIITKGHGGDLKVETKEGEGARFIITLPV